MSITSDRDKLRQKYEEKKSQGDKQTHRKLTDGQITNRRISHASFFFQKLKDLEKKEDPISRKLFNMSALLKTPGFFLWKKISYSKYAEVSKTRRYGHYK